MFTIDCHRHGTRVELAWSHVEAMRHTTVGTVVDWRCSCGARGSLIDGTRSVPWTTEPPHCGLDSVASGQTATS
jgi:hypothetical protein